MCSLYLQQTQHSHSFSSEEACFHNDEVFDYLYIYVEFSHTYKVVHTYLPAYKLDLACYISSYFTIIFDYATNPLPPMTMLAHCHIVTNVEDISVTKDTLHRTRMVVKSR